MIIIKKTYLQCIPLCFGVCLLFYWFFGFIAWTPYSQITATREKNCCLVMKARLCRINKIANEDCAGVKCPPFFFGVTLVHVNLCLHTFTNMTVTLRGMGGRGLFKKVYSCWKMYQLCQSEKFVERFKMEYQSILYKLKQKQCVFEKINHPSHGSSP